QFKAKIQKVDLNSLYILGSVILVIGIGLYALFAPGVKNMRLGNPACGKIVVAADGPSLKSNVAPTLSGARYFLVINPLSEKLLQTVKNPYAAMPQAQGANVAYLIAGKGEEAVIAGSVSPQCYRVLTQFGVRSFGGFNGTVKDAVALYRKARISQGPSQMGNISGRQVAFGFGQHLFKCPACNWQIKDTFQGNRYPNCPNCGSPMAMDMSNQMWGNVQNGFEQGMHGLSSMGWGTAAGTMPFQPRLGFWQGGINKQLFICPGCNWRMFAQQDQGQFPRCPNCRGMMALGDNLIQGVQPAAFNNSIPAPPIYSDAQMPHAYRGVCSNCHQILKQAQNTLGLSPAATTPAAFGRSLGGGTCILR
ncbi:magnetochrome domain-containing protein, partial [Patescibacteria group bacterium]|nr:magnetochrome domain-containing protein [Patescibacteria group bacterium]